MNKLRNSPKQRQLDFFHSFADLDCRAADPYPIPLIARRYRLSRTAARLIAEAAGFRCGGDQ